MAIRGAELSTMVVVRGWKEGLMRSYWLMGIELWFFKLMSSEDG